MALSDTPMSKPYSSRTMRLEDWDEIDHFTPSEFKKPGFMGYEFMLWLDEVREEAGVPMLISSSYRSDEYNDQIGGAPDSAHEDKPCNAVDIRKNPKAKLGWNHDRAAITMAAIKFGCVRWGVYQDESLHFDRTEHKRPAPRCWIKAK